MIPAARGSSLSPLTPLMPSAGLASELLRHSEEAIAEVLRVKADLELVLEHSPAMIAMWRHDRTLRCCNRRYAEAQGMTPEQIRDLTVEQALGVETARQAHPRIDLALAGQPQTFEREIHLPDGSIRHELVDYRAHERPGEAPGLFVFASDITTRKLAERQLKESREQFRQLYENSPGILHSMDRAGQLLSVSDTWLAKLGYARNDVIGRPILDFLTEASRGYLRDVVYPGFHRTGCIEDAELQMQTRTGAILDVRMSAISQYDEAGVFQRSLSVIQDVTDAVRAERALRESEAFLDRTGRVAGVGGWSYDAATDTLNGSDQTFEIHDVPRGRVPAMADLLAFYAPDDRAALKIAMARCLAERVPFDLELQMITARGRRVWVRAVGEGDFDGERVRRLFGTVQDITLRKQAEEALASQNELLRVTLDSIADAVITTDEHGMIRWLNPVAEQLTGWPLATARGASIDLVYRVVREDSRSAAPSPLQRALRTRPVDATPSQTLLVARQGGERAIEDAVAPIRDSHGCIQGIVLTFRDVSAQRRLAREVEYRATRDALTGLPNRSEFELQLGRAYQRARCDRVAHSLMYIDLDQFKLVNDSCGHAAGDQLLQQVASLLLGLIPASDCVARLGGDEFGVILENCTSAQARPLAEEICAHMEQFRFMHEGRRFRIGTSIGLVPLDARWPKTSAVMQAADAACYAAKEAGRNRVHEWLDTDAAMNVRQNDMRWATEIEEALDEDRFRLFGQRIAPCAAQAGGLRFEVLLRLIDGSGKLVAPGAFLPAAERFQMSPRIDRWVVRETLNWMSGQNLDGVDLITVNLSGQSLGDRSFHAYVAERIAGVPFNPGKLCFEITETTAITHMGDATAFIRRMRALGIRIALDDFGTGASSFGYLKSLPVDILKIDGQFVTDLLEDRLDQAAVHCFQEVARACNLQTVAEFVETEAVFDELRRIGVHFAQGYLIHKPEALDALLASAVPCV